MRARLFIAGLLLPAVGALAQERFGLLHSNYGGTDITVLNPARSAAQWPWMDLRLVGADAFVWNSLVAWTGRERPLIDELRSNSGGAGGDLVMRSLHLSRTHHATVAANVLGPAVSIALGRSSVGFGIRSRTYVSASGISPELGRFIYEGLNYAPQHGTRYHDQGIRALGAAWTEAGINYAHILRSEGFGMLSAGINARYLMGHAAGAFQITDLDYTVYDTARIDIHEISARYGFAQPAMNAGNGWGADLGITYERTMDEVNDYRPHRGGAGCTPQRYRYRIGLSLVDLGGIRFAQAEAGTINAGSLSIPDHDDMRVRGIEGIDSVLAGATNWTRTNGLRMGLPTGISLQYDQRLADFAYIGLAAVHPLSGRNSMRLRRANAIALTPRLETRYAELAVPIVLHEFDLAKPTVGFMLRLHGLVVGTDHILPFISKRDVHALDLYVRVRWMIFRSPACGNGKRSRTGSLAHRSGSKDMVPCTIPGSGK
ncbi:MAG: DUF5723 family protein [Flavobacteriales bacterium]